MTAFCPPGRASRPLALSYAPLSNEHKAKVEAQLGRSDLAWLSVMELREMGISRAWRALRATRGSQAWLVQDEPAARALRPVFEIVAGISGAARFAVLEDRGAPVQLGFVRLAGAVTRLVGATLHGAACAFLNALDTKRLMRARPVEPTRGGADVLYCKTSLLLGVRAGGAVGHVAGVVNEFVDRGLPVTYSAVEPPLCVRPSLRYLPVAPVETSGWPLELNLHALGRRFVATHRTLWTTPPRFIYQRLALCDMSGVALSRTWRVPLVLEYNGSEAWAQRNWGKGLKLQQLTERIEDVCLRHAHLVVTISQVLADELAARGIPPERIVWYPNGIDPTRYDPARYAPAAQAAVRARAGIAPDATVATFVGTFGAWHGVDFLAHAVVRLVERHRAWLERHKVCFLWVGDGMLMPTVRRILEGEASRWCVLTGLVGQDEAPAWLAASDVLLSPHLPNADGSRFFGSPTKLFEYMAMERGILAADLEQIGDVLRPAIEVGALPLESPGDDVPQQAVLHRPGDLDGFIEGFRFLVERADWRRALARNARQTALREHTWKQHVDRITARLEALGI